VNNQPKIPATFQTAGIFIGGEKYELATYLYK
jgi:hypothetical protein